MKYEVSGDLTCKLPLHQQDRPGSLSCSVFLFPLKKRKDYLLSLLLPSGRRCYPSWQAIPPSLLFMPSAAWPPNHLHGCPSYLALLSLEKRGPPYFKMKCQGASQLYPPGGPHKKKRVYNILLLTSNNKLNFL